MNYVAHTGNRRPLVPSIRLDPSYFEPPAALSSNDRVEPELPLWTPRSPSPALLRSLRINASGPTLRIDLRAAARAPSSDSGSTRVDPFNPTASPTQTTFSTFTAYAASSTFGNPRD
jgi:hypothetical protein